MNELLFVIHIVAITLSTLCALRIGKEALITLVVIQALLANLFVIKQIPLFSLCVTCTDAFAVGSGLALNVIQEYFGRSVAKKTILVSFLALIFYMVMAQFQLWYIPIIHDHAHAHYYYILHITPRLITASVISYLLSQSANYALFNIFKSYTQRFVLQSYGALCISQLIDTIAFSFIGLYGIVQSVFHIIIFSYIIKVATIVIATSLTSILRRYAYGNHLSKH
jgi:queuosine precursor transporter